MLVVVVGALAVGMLTTCDLSDGAELSIDPIPEDREAETDGEPTVEPPPTGALVADARPARAPEALSARTAELPEPEPEPEPSAGTPTAAPAETPAPTPAAPPPPASSGIRGAWVHLFDDSLKSSAGIQRVVDEAATAGVNTLIVQVVRRHDAYHRSSVLPRTPDPRLQSGLDVLDEVLRHARPRGIDVHAWIVVAPTYHGAYSSLTHPPGWVYREHGPKAPEADRWVTRSRDGAWGEYLDLGLPEVSDHVVRVAREIAANYPVAGVHLDYARYPGPEWGYHPRAMERFRAETGRTDTPGIRDEQWSAWRRAQATDLVRRVTRAVHGARSGTVVSAATIAWGDGPTSAAEFRSSRTYRDVFQDWPAWAADGSVDHVYPMLYFRSAEDAAWFDRWLAFTAQVASGSRGEVAAGVGAWLNTSDATVDQLRRGEQSTDGAIVYSWQQPSNGDRDATLRAIRGLWGPS